MTKVEVGKKEKPKEVFHDQAPAIVTDHAFEPLTDEWWSRCKHCTLYEAAHSETTLHHPVSYVKDHPVVYVGDEEDDE